MKRIVLILCILSASNAFARDWHPFVGMGGIVEFPESGEGNTRFWCSGTQFEAGVRRAHLEYYLAYRFANSIESNRENYSWQTSDTVEIRTRAYDSRSRSEKRILVGIRYRPLPQGSNMAPLIGMSFGTGRSKIWRNIQYTSDYYSMDPRHNIVATSEWWWHKDVTSAYCAEVAMEVGVTFHVYKGVEILALSQYRAWFIGYKFRGNHSDPNEVTLKTSTLPSLGLQLRYTL